MNLSSWVRTFTAVVAFALTGGAAIGQTAPTDTAAAMSFLATLPADERLAVMEREANQVREGRPVLFSAKPR